MSNAARPNRFQSLIHNEQQPSQPVNENPLIHDTSSKASRHLNRSAYERQAFKNHHCQWVEDLATLGLSAWDSRVHLVCSPTVRRNDVGQSMVEQAILIPSTRFSSCQGSLLLVGGNRRAWHTMDDGFGHGSGIVKK
jgi:hypothetical protein